MNDDHQNEHDHSQPTHAMQCPVDGCEFKIEVHAHDDEHAVMKLMLEGKSHFEQVHADQEGMSPEEMEKVTKESMEKLQ